MANNDTIKKTVTVAFLLCIVCSVVVSSAGVLLRPAQKANKALDLKRNLLASAGMLEEGKSVDEMFSKITTKVIDLETGKFTDAISVDGYDQIKAAGDPKLSVALSADEDIAKLSRREKYGTVYMVENNGQLEKLILPIRGYGLWGTLYGFLALESDLNTVVGMGYYDHKETPGLGAEVDNPNWKGLWPGKQLYANDGSVAIEVIKGAVSPGTPGAVHKVDGLSGATLTGKGVHNMMQYWFGESGYSLFLKNLKNGEA